MNMKCINCYAKEDENGVIKHKRTCPDWARPNHETRSAKHDKTGK